MAGDGGLRRSLDARARRTLDEMSMNEHRVCAYCKGPLKGILPYRIIPHGGDLDEACVVRLCSSPCLVAWIPSKSDPTIGDRPVTCGACGAKLPLSEWGKVHDCPTPTHDYAIRRIRGAVGFNTGRALFRVTCVSCPGSPLVHPGTTSPTAQIEMHEHRAKRGELEMPWSPDDRPPVYCDCWCHEHGMRAKHGISKCDRCGH